MTGTRTQLHDTRSMTVEEAEALLQEYATLAIAVEVEEAKAEKQIAAIKARAEEKTDPAVERMKGLESMLRLFVLGNRKLFQKRRSHKTSWGEIGLRKSTRLTIRDEAAVFAAAENNEEADGILRITTAIDKPALTKLVREGLCIPGVELDEGDIAYVKVAKALVQAAVEAV